MNNSSIYKIANRTLICSFSIFSGIPAMVDFAAMREAVKTLGGDPKNVHPACPTDLTVDHSLQIDFSKWYFNTALLADSQPTGGVCYKGSRDHLCQSKIAYI